MIYKLCEQKLNKKFNIYVGLIALFCVLLNPIQMLWTIF